MKSLPGFCVLLFAIVLYQSCYAVASEKGSISGLVLDSQNREPIYYALISVYPKGSTKPVNGATADENGAFTIKNLAAGTYRLEINFLGYKPFIKDSVFITEKAYSIKLGTILLSKKVNMLKEVTVNGERSAIEYKSDKIVYNVEQDLTAQGGQATDVLKKVPSVTVDVDGNVEIQGNASIKF